MKSEISSWLKSTNPWLVSNTTNPKPLFQNILKHFRKTQTQTQNISLPASLHPQPPTSTQKRVFSYLLRLSSSNLSHYVRTVKQCLAQQSYLPLPAQTPCCSHHQKGEDTKGSREPQTQSPFCCGTLPLRDRSHSKMGKGEQLTHQDSIQSVSIAIAMFHLKYAAQNTDDMVKNCSLC